MTNGPSQQGPSAARTSYSHGGMYRARVESIDDPERRNRVQVRIFGYQDDLALNPKDKLEWIHVVQHNSQMKGDTSTQPYYPGAFVLVSDTGTERTIIGATPGMDSETNLLNTPQSADPSEGKIPDVPHHQHGKQGNIRSRIRQSPGINEGDGSNYFKYANWPKMLVQLWQYATGKAPYNEGQNAILHKLKSTGVDKLQLGSDVLYITKQLDGNFSGAFKPAVDLILSNRRNGFGNGLQLLGAGPIGMAMSAFNQSFAGIPFVGNLIAALQNTAQTTKTASQLKPNTLLASINDLIVMLETLKDVALNVDSGIISSIQASIDALQSSGPNMNAADLASHVAQIQANVQSALNQATTNVMQNIEQLSALAGGGASTVAMLGGQSNTTAIAKQLATVANQVGMPSQSISNLAGGVIGMALNNQLGQLGQLTAGAAAQLGPLLSKISTWQFNPIAMQEILGGQVSQKFLTKIKKRYVEKEPNKAAKKHEGDIRGISLTNNDNTPPNTPSDLKYDGPF